MANALVLVPVLVVGWIFRMRGGLLARVLSYPLNVLFAAVLAEGRAWETLSLGSAFGQAIVVIGGAVVGRLHDLDEQAKKQALELEHQAFHNSLTDLPNRVLSMDRLEHALERTARRQEALAVLFLDLDRFKRINDSLGHKMGDKLLIVVGDRLQAYVRQGDTVSRLGADEFTILLKPPMDADTAIRVAERITGALRVPFDLGRDEVFITVSTGILLSSSFQDRPEDLLRNVDNAMYRVKKGGKARYAVFE